MVSQGSTFEQSVHIKHLGNKKCSLFIIKIGVSTQENFEQTPTLDGDDALLSAANTSDLRCSIISMPLVKAERVAGY